MGGFCGFYADIVPFKYKGLSIRVLAKGNNFLEPVLLEYTRLLYIPLCFLVLKVV